MSRRAKTNPDRVPRLTEKEVAEIAGKSSDYETLRQGVLDYISECDNPVPDALNRRTLRNILRKLSDATPEPPLRRPIHRRS